MVLINKNTWKSELNIIIQDLSIGHGHLNVMIKDSIDIQGYITTAGSRALANSKPAEKNAKVIDLILEHDARITAKTTLHELAFGITGINQHFGTPQNPHYPDLIPGGSSSGSAAAVAAGLADFTLGTDTGGSVRMPAACCGVYGLKPTFGRVSREGIHPEKTTLDCVGPFANSVDMLQCAMQIIDPTFKPIRLDKAPRLALLNVEASDEIWNCIHQFLSRAQIVADKTEAPLIQNAFDAGMQIINYETWEAFGELTKTGLVSSDVNARLIKASQTTRADVAEAEKVRIAFTKQIDALLEQYDALLLPTLPQFPPKVVDAANTVAFLNLTALVRPFNLSGHPALTIPLDHMHAPVGLQVITKKNADEQLCAIADFLVKSAQ